MVPPLSTFDETNPRSLDVALMLRHQSVCPDQLHSAVDGDAVRVLRAGQLADLDRADHFELVCPDGERKPLDEWRQCNYNGRLMGNAVFARAQLTDTELETYVHGFVALSDKFGHGARTEDVFELFGEFEAGEKNVLFGDDSAAFVASPNAVERTADEDAYRKMHCVQDEPKR